MLCIVWGAYQDRRSRHRYYLLASHVAALECGITRRVGTHSGSSAHLQMNARLSVIWAAGRGGPGV